MFIIKMYSMVMSTQSGALGLTPPHCLSSPQTSKGMVIAQLNGKLSDAFPSSKWPRIIVLPTEHSICKSSWKKSNVLHRNMAVFSVMMVQTLVLPLILEQLKTRFHQFM